MGCVRLSERDTACAGAQTLVTPPLTLERRPCAKRCAAGPHQARRREKRESARHAVRASGSHSAPSDAVGIKWMDGIASVTVGWQVNPALYQGEAVIFV
jgi:hypothetical protein